MKGIKITDATKLDHKELFKLKKEFSISLPDSYTHTLIARSSLGTLLGFIELSYSKPKFLEIKRLAIRKKFKKIGVGRKLVSIARAISIKDGRRILVNSLLTTEALNFWKVRQGFKSKIKSRFSKSRFEMFEEVTLRPKPVKRIIKPKGIKKLK